MEGNNSIIKIFEAISANSGCNRAELSEMTGYSLMTVGKAVDALEKAGLIGQEKQPNGSVGRKMSICTVNGSCGFLLLDLTRDKPAVRIYDMHCDVHGEFTAVSDSLDELIPLGFGGFFDTLGGEILGIGCVVPDGKAEEYIVAFASAVGNPPEMAVESSEAYSEAKADKLDGDGISLVLQCFSDGSARCSVRVNGAYHGGAHGNAGKRICGEEKCIVGYVCDLCEFLDPLAVHIACEADGECERVAASVLEELESRRGAVPHIFVESADMREDALAGAAVMMRKKLIIGKMSKNS